jgi:hypothetical protein
MGAILDFGLRNVDLKKTKKGNGVFTTEKRVYETDS